jgi:endonuclease-3
MRRHSMTPPKRQPKTDTAVVDRTMRRLQRLYPVDHFDEAHGADPFRVLIGCLLSLRTKDEDSFPAAERLFAKADAPAAMLKVPLRTIERAIYPVGFYRRKAEQVHAICRTLIDRYGGDVPGEIDELLTLPGVGRKTANLVVTRGFGRPGICVDTHVHRITNRLGWVKTGSPNETETVLRAFLPRRHWIPINELLVRHGQEVCRPISPRCSVCTLRPDCPQRGVGRSR